MKLVWLLVLTLALGAGYWAWGAFEGVPPRITTLDTALPSAGALEGARSITEYRTTGYVPDRMTPQREQALERIGERMGLIRELAIIGGVSDSDPRPRQGRGDRGGRGDGRRSLAGARSGPRSAGARARAGRGG